MTRQTEAFDELLRLMQLEQLEDNLFRGVSRDIGTERVFGGRDAQRLRHGWWSGVLGATSHRAEE